LCAFDYSQIELRIAAFLSHDEKLIEIFKKGEDIHTEVAAQVFNVPEEQVDKEMRRRAKVINFGILYGMGVNALKDNLGTTRAEAQKFYNDYFEVFTGLARYLEEVKADAERRGYTTTFFGRRRYFEGIRSPIPYIKAQAERMAVNAPIQGTNADIVKIAMKKIDDYIEANKLRDKVRLLLQIHDELIFEIEDSVLLDVGKEIRRIMEEEVLPSDKISGIKLLSSLSKGKNWGELY
jgi:DNA polymerase-1